MLDHPPPALRTPPHRPHSTSPDGGFWVQFTVPGCTLDEDWGQDEVYAKVSVWHPGTHIRSNTVKGYY